MRPQALVTGDGDDGVCVVCQRLRGILDDAGVLDEFVGGKRRGVARGAAGGKRVVGAGHVVAHGLGGPLAHEDGAGVADGAELLERAVEVQLQVLGGDDVDGLDGLLHGVADDHKALIGQRGGGDLGARGSLHVALDGGFDLVGVALVERDQVAACQRVVLGLGHEVDGHHGGVGGLIGHDAHLGGAGDHIDSHVAGDDLLRSRHERVARTCDLADRLDGLGAVGQRRHGLRAAYRVDLGDAGQAAGLEHHRVDAAVLGGRRDAHDALDAGDRGGQGVHEHRGRVQRAAAGHVDANAFKRGDLRTDQGAVLAHGEPALLDLTLVELANLLGGLLERLLGFGIDLRRGGLDGLGRHAEVLDGNAVEALGQLAQGRIALFANLLDDVRCRLHGAGVERARALEVLVGELLAFVQDDATHVVLLSMYTPDDPSGLFHDDTLSGPRLRAGASAALTLRRPTPRRLRARSPDQLLFGRGLGRLHAAGDDRGLPLARRGAGAHGVGQLHDARIGAQRGAVGEEAGRR